MSVVKKCLAAISCAVIICIIALAITPTAPQKPVISLKNTNIELTSNRHTQIDVNANVSNKLSTDGYVKKLSNVGLEVWFRKEADSLRIVDKSSGYIWGSLPADKVEDLNRLWSEMANSICTIQYFDLKGTERKLSLSDRDMTKSYIWNASGFTCDVSIRTLGFKFKFSMKLSDRQITFNLDSNSIQETSKNLFESIYFMPFFGSTHEDEINGYMLVPDGPGALIRYRKPTQYLSNYEEKIFGKDFGIDMLDEANDLKSTRPNDYAAPEPQITMPVFGVVHGAGQNAFLAVVEGGAEYASILAYASGTITNYNWVTARFDYRQKYMQPTSRDGAGVLIPAPDKNQMNPKISFYFISGKDADYSGMA